MGLYRRLLLVLAFSVPKDASTDGCGKKVSSRLSHHSWRQSPTQFLLRVAGIPIMTGSFMPLMNTLPRRFAGKAERRFRTGEWVPERDIKVP